MLLMAASAVFFFLLLPALLLIWISPRWTWPEKVVATVIPAALLVATRAIHDDTGDPARTMGMLAIASCIFMAFFLAARLADRRKRPH